MGRGFKSPRDHIKIGIIADFFVAHGLLYFFLLVATGLVCYLVAGIYDGSALFNVLYKFSVCCIIPNVFFLIVFFRTKEFQYYLQLLMRIKGRVMGRKNK